MIINEEQLIKDIACNEGENTATVRKVINGIEHSLYSYLSCAAPDETVTVKILKGLSIESKYIPAKKCRDPRTQDTITTNPKLRCKPKLTDYFNKKLNKDIIF